VIVYVYSPTRVCTLLRANAPLDKDIDNYPK
jgi:hypothetical protein